VWRPYLHDTIFICVFRDPASTAKSMIKECSDVKRLRNIKINFPIALEIWTLMYQHILEIHRCEGKWLFLHFNQVLTKEGLDRIEDFIGAAVDRSFPELCLRHSFSELPVPHNVRNIYQKLCKLAEYED